MMDARGLDSYRKGKSPERIGRNAMTTSWTRQRSARVSDYSEREIELRNLEIWAGEEVEKVSPGDKEA